MDEEKGRVGNEDKSERRKKMREGERVRCRKMGWGERTREKSCLHGYRYECQSSHRVRSSEVLTSFQAPPLWNGKVYTWYLFSRDHVKGNVCTLFNQQCV